jgi:ABC-type lipoprotein release transport system permease subunit
VAVGVDPESESRASAYAERLAAGRFLRPGERGAAVVGKELTGELGLEVGAKIRLVVPGPEGSSPHAIEYEVVGVYAMGGEIGRRVVLVDLEGLSEALGAPDGAGEVGVVLAEDSPLAPARDELVRHLREAGLGSANVRTWCEILPTTVDIIRLDDIAMNLIMVVVFVTVALGVLNTMMMSVYERFHELGVLRAVGTRPWQCVRLVAWEALLLAAWGAAVGCLLALAVTGYFAARGLDLSPYLENNEHFTLEHVIYAHIEWGDFALAAGVVCATAVAGAAGPAVRAARLEVTEALRAT